MRAALATLFALACSHAQAASDAVLDGIAFKLDMGERASLRLTDERSGQPLRGLHPNAWLSLRRSEQIANERSCDDKVRAFASGRLADRADVDLNNFVLITHNHDNTVAFINPQVSLSTTKLESIVALPAKGLDWVLSADNSKLFVSMPQAGAVAVIDTAARKLIKTLDMGAGAKPGHLALQPDGLLLWVSLENKDSIRFIELSSMEDRGSLQVGQGVHNVAFSADGEYAFVSSASSNTVSIIRARTRAKLADVPVGATPVALAWNEAARLLYVAAINDTHISVIDADKRAVIARLAAARGVVALRNSGRYVLALNQLDSSLSVIDSATQRITGSGKTVGSPDQLTLTQRYAYVRGTATEKISLFDLAALAKGEFNPVEVQAGQRAPKEASEELGIADMIAPMPGGSSAIIANPADRTLYVYTEGMMAPAGTLRNYSRIPRGIMVLDRSLKETAPGVYSAPVKVARGGRYDVVVALEQPRKNICFQAAIAGPAHAPDDQARAARAKLEALGQSDEIQTGSELALRFRLSSADGKRALTDIPDVQVLIVKAPTTWQKKLAARHVGDGVYEARTTFSQPGRYQVVAGSASLDLGFAQSAPRALTVVEHVAGSRAGASAR